MNYTNESDFDGIPKSQDTAPWITPFSHFDTALQLLSSDQSQILRDASNELLNAHVISIDSQHDYGYPGSCGKF